MKLTGSGVLALAALIAAAIAFIYLWKKKDVIASAVDPTSDKNLAYSGAGKIVSIVSGGAEESVGGVFARFREWVSGDTAAIEKMKLGNKPSGDPFNPYSINPRDRT